MAPGGKVPGAPWVYRKFLAKKFHFFIDFSCFFRDFHLFFIKIGHREKNHRFCTHKRGYFRHIFFSMPKYHFISKIRVTLKSVYCKNQRTSKISAPQKLVQHKDQRNRLDIQQITECFQCTFCLMCKNFFRKNLTKLYAFLVEAVYIPCKSLVHDFVFEVGKKRSHGPRC